MRQNGQRLAWGEARIDSGKVFTQADGSVLNPDWVFDKFERICRAAELPMIRLQIFVTEQPR
ncbi:hypothetical protein [Amycolatopsis sp. Hca4]|uniref:hypothetical protein n=1 Tax=Amycolatopsis sp. Hca4 TaxID=2742131 RepID=UPI001C378E2E|nr:hypothetical protein [Amycolatopsis sp. Hca4]